MDLQEFRPPIFHDATLMLQSIELPTRDELECPVAPTDMPAQPVDLPLAPFPAQLAEGDALARLGLVAGDEPVEVDQEVCRLALVQARHESETSPPNPTRFM